MESGAAITLPSSQRMDGIIPSIRAIIPDGRRAVGCPELTIQEAREQIL